MKDKSVGILNKWLPLALIYVICVCFLAAVLIVATISLTYNVRVTMEPSEVPQIFLNPAYWLILFTGLVALVYRLRFQIAKLNSNWLFVALATVFILCGTYLIVFADDFLRRADPWSCVTIARHLNDGLYGDLSKNGYAHGYPFQLYWISVLRILLRINNSIRFLYAINLLFSFASVILMFFICKKILRTKFSINISLLFMFLFLPLFFNTLFVYSNVLALTIFLAGILLFLSSENNKYSYIYLFGSAILLSVSALVKNNYLIGLTAFVIVVWFTHFKTSIKFIVVIFTGLFILSSNILITNYYSSKSNENVSMRTSIPKSAYLVMGLNDHGVKSGWYDSSTVDLYSNSGNSATLTDKKAKIKLKKRVIYLSKHPIYTISFFRQKWITTWGDPTFQSLFNAPLPTWGGKLKTSIMRQIYDPSGETKFSKLIRRISQVNVWFIIIFSIPVSINILKETYHKVSESNILMIYVFYAFLFFIGGFTFHTFWEIKSQYVYQYIFILVPVASSGLSLVITKVEKACQAL